MKRVSGSAQGKRNENALGTEITAGTTLRQERNLWVHNNNVDENKCHQIDSVESALCER